MKIVNVIGGLGNQMFQYAFALSLKNKFQDEDVLIDTHHFNHYNLHNGYELNLIFKNVEFQFATKEQLKSVTRYIPHYKISRFVRKLFPKLESEYVEKYDYIYSEEPFLIKDDCYYEGYWQSYKYYEDINKEIVHAFQFPVPTDYNKKVADEISLSNSVGLHIRRGDYLNHKDFKGICELDYYQRAINDLLRTPDRYKFFIFSNDIEWCIKNIKPLVEDHPIVFVTENKGRNSFWDMYLMSLCKNLIIANSSFSWWAAYLNSVAKHIYVPQKWINREHNVEIYNPQWIKI